MNKTLLARAVALLAAAGLLTGAAQATTLAEAYAAARAFDGQYGAAGFELEAARLLPQTTRAALLPNIALRASTSNVTGTRDFPNSLNQEVRVPVDYTTPQASLQLRQPLFNYEAIARHRQAGVQVEGAEAQYEARGLDLAERVGVAYLQAGLAVEGVALAEAELTAARGLKQRAEQRLLRGEGTRTEVAQADANVEVVGVRLLEAHDQVEVARRALRRITGLDVTQLRSVPAGFVPDSAWAGKLGDWIEMSERQSPLLRMRQRSVDVARVGIERSRAGHLPQVELFAGLTRSRNESISSLDQTSTLRSIGVQLSVPLYSGGGVEATIRQAVAEVSRAEEEFRAERSSLHLDVQRQYQAVAGGAQRVEAYRRVVAASEVALEGATRSLAAGLATQTEVLDAHARRYVALRDLAQVRSEYLASRLKLMSLAGMPVAEIVAETDRLLVVERPIKPRSTP